ncbi:hypothetical protein [Dapis sp. BLCC M229]|uniref:hypothetical protein n=1 Tax=Dapis sp. BLCC M229 TaxID=3400188 RepID=UPI003CE7A4FF
MYQLTINIPEQRALALKLTPEELSQEMKLITTTEQQTIDPITTIQKFGSDLLETVGISFLIMFLIPVIPLLSYFIWKKFSR